MRSWTTLALIAGLSGLAFPASAQEQDIPPMPQPTAEHALLMKDVGVWDAVVKSWAAPDQEPMESKATETVSAIGGFWQVARFESEVMGQPFEGHSLVGWDPIHQQYVSSWVDSISPAISHGKATYDADTRTLTGSFEGIGPDGKPSRMKQVTHWTDDDHRTLTLSVEGPDGHDVTVMQIDYTRR